MSFREWWRGWLGESRPEPPAILTKAEVTERVKAYAEANGRRFEEPIGFELKRRPRNRKDPQAGHRWVYTLGLGTNRPMPMVEVDAVEGTVLAWRALPR